jgi:hypothetical protein
MDYLKVGDGEEIVVADEFSWANAISFFGYGNVVLWTESVV